ncbi:bacteriorhodopsin [Thiocystis violacea]|uniref:bacteriorhodopsin n=1 Tax=Thiocystis violacea TaxID=13725 RepID=UPI0019089D20|nr:bacteriorhodopsin [Thiocystis violacea]MBK1716426.1 hypothetical protein [Thiocystis violacea]
MTTLFSLTYFSFLFCSLAAFLAVVYFLAQFPRIEPKLRLLVLLNVIICGLSSALHLYYFASLQPLVSGAAEPAILIRALGEFPLSVRYGYWLITTVMLILMFPLLIGVERVGTGFALGLALADAGMISAGYVGEQSMLSAGEATNLSLLCFALGVTLWVSMLISIYRVLRKLPSDELIPAQRDTLGYMFFFILVGWTIYPAGYFHTVLFEQGIGVVLREFTFNLGDLVNKVIWGLLVIHAAREISRARRERFARDA